MLKQLALRIFAVLAMLGAAIVAVSGGSIATAQSSAWIDTSDRAAVLAAYTTEYSKAEPAMGWTGNLTGCEAGTTSAAFRQASVDRVNFMRQLAGLPASAVESAALTDSAMQASLANAANDQLSHSITTGQNCYTAAANTGAEKSNIATANGYQAIGLYMDDAGSPTTGHRIGILHPPLKNIGVGDVDGANSLYWLDNAFAADPAMREQTGFVAWPPRGFVPSELVYERWSFLLRGADFATAQVTVTSAGSAVTAEVVERRSTSNGVPFSVITFDVPSAVGNPAVDTIYSVSISGVADASATSFDYDVTVIGGEAAPETTETATAAEIGPVTVPLPEALAAATNLTELRAAEGFDAVEDEKVLTIYTELFERPADIGGAKYWLELRRNGHDPADLRDHMKDGIEYAPKAVTEVYTELLERAPDAAGLEYWTGVRKSGASRAAVASWIKMSEEYRSVSGAMQALVALKIID